MSRTSCSFRFRTQLAATVLLSACVISCAIAPPPTLSDDEKNFGSPEDILFWTPSQQIAGYRNNEKIAPTRVIRAGDSVYALPVERVELDDVSFSSDETDYTIDEYFASTKIAGLLVIKNGKIVYERYGLGNTKDTSWISFSVAKSVTSLLVGAAIRDGYIKSVDEKVTDYLPRLKDSSYDEVSIRNILQMSSGVEWNEDYEDRNSDINRVEWDTLGLYEYLRAKPRDAAPGEVFNYNTAETNLVGTLLRSAIGNNLSTYLSEKIWVPFGMEADAYWGLVEPGGGEFGGCCISATLRDYGRIGLFVLNGGKLADGTEVLAEGWMRESTTPSRGSPDYGYQWWLEGDGVFGGYGVFGQRIYVDPKEGVVIAQHSAWPHADHDSDWLLQNAMYEGIVAALRE